MRFSPDGLSFISAPAWKDIYGHTTGKKVPNLLDPRVYGMYDNGEDDLSTIHDLARHGQVRRIFSHAFSQKAINLQEPLMQKYVDKLINKLRTSVKSSPTDPIDLCDMYNRTTFDIMGDMAFGVFLDLLDNDKYKSWIDAMFGAAKGEAILDIVAVYPKLRTLMAFFSPKTWKKDEEEHYAFCAELIKKRLDQGRDEPDIWNFVLSKGKNVLSTTEMHNNASLFMMGGTDTTAAALCGLTYLLLQNPEKLAKVVAEVRNLTAEEMSNGANLVKLPYLNACFEETLRMYPQGSEGFPRVIPRGGNIIAGEYLPAEVSLYRVR